MGKKHGSLTRAGKVRKQTPKVEKKDRLKKLPVGRAKKRRQYGKRYAVIIPEASAAAKKKFRSNRNDINKK
jgi:small subunit ribosomal protein S30e